MIKKVFTFCHVFLILSCFEAVSQDGSLDPNFVPNGPLTVRAIQRLNNGQVVLTYSSGIGGGIRLLNSDGSETNVQFETPPQQTEYSGNHIKDIIQLLNGKLLFINSAASKKLCLYNLDGSLDSEFQTNIGTGANLNIRKGLLDADGKIVLIGDFTTFNDIPKSNIVRLNPNGTIDETFVTTVSNSTIKDIVHNENGGYFIGGVINGVNGQYNYTNTVKLTQFGEVDTTFRCYEGGFNQIAMTPDGKLIGLQGAETGSGAPKIINRYNIDGTEDITLGGYEGNNVVDIHVQADGKIIFTGGFSLYRKFGTTDETPVNGIFRILPDGTFDTTFDPGSGPDYSIAFSQHCSDGSIMLGGSFENFDSQPRVRGARLINSGIPSEIISTGIEHSISESTVKVFPNPFDKSIKISDTTEKKELILKVFSIIGHEVYHGNLMPFEEKTIPTEDWPQGLYLVSLIEKSGQLLKNQLITK